MLVPLYGFLKGDVLGLVILAYSDETVHEVAEKLRQAACMRVASAGELQLYFRGERLDPDSTVAEVGLHALDRIDVTQS